MLTYWDVGNAIIKVTQPMNPFIHLNLIGRSPLFLQSLSAIMGCAGCDATSLIMGETGTGKELAARAIHYLGGRRDMPFVPVNCGSIPDHLVESELFGHVRGAFTDAREARVGLVTAADGGVLFLDEIEAMSLRMQAALLRFLQDREYRPVGSSSVKKVNVRIIAASNVDLFAMAEQGLFRKDILYRLNVLTLEMPPLRKRTGDAALLAEIFIERLNRAHEGAYKYLDPHCVKALNAHSWPGNVRELENFIHRQFLTGSGQKISFTKHAAGAMTPTFFGSNGFDLSILMPEHEALPDRRRGNRRNIDIGALSEPKPSATGPDELERPLLDRTISSYEDFKRAKDQLLGRLEKEYIASLLLRAGGNVSLASRLSGKDRSDLCKVLKKHGLNREQYNSEPSSSPTLAQPYTHFDDHEIDPELH